MKFKLDKNQVKRLKEWQEKIKQKHGEYGYYDFIFTPFGMGTGVKVKSYLTKQTLDLTNINDW